MASTIKKFNRGKLKRLAIAGKLTMVEGYSFDDMLGETRTNKELPVAFSDNRADWVDGTVWLSSHHFESKSGCCYEKGIAADGCQLVTLIVHSNSNYTFKVNK